MYTDKDSLGNDVNMYADNKPNCEECSLAMGLPVTNEMLNQEKYSEIPEKTDKQINIIEATSISIEPSESIELLPGGSVKLSIKTEPFLSNEPNLTWESSDLEIAIVTSEGIVYANKVGEVDIMATNPENNKLTSKVTINVVDKLSKKVESIELTPNTKSIAKKETFTPSISITPEDATNKEVSWESDSAHATVDSESGLVTGVSAGEANITATAKDGSGVKATCVVTVNPTKVATITVEPSTKSTTVASGKFSLSATVSPDDADDKGVTWSSDSEHATVDPSTGEVTPVSIGSANIIATAKDGSGVTGKCAVTITE